MPPVHNLTFAFTVETVVLMGRTARGGLISRPSARDREQLEALISDLRRNGYSVSHVELN